MGYKAQIMATIPDIARWKMNFAALLENQNVSLGFVFNILKALETENEIESFLSTYKNWHKDYNALLNENEINGQFKMDMNFYINRLSEEDNNELVNKIQNILKKI